MGTSLIDISGAIVFSNLVGFSGKSFSFDSDDLASSGVFEVDLLGSGELCDILDKDRCGLGDLCDIRDRDCSNSCDLWDVLENNRCGPSDLGELLEVDRLGSFQPLLAGTKVEDELSGIENSGGGVSVMIER